MQSSTASIKRLCANFPSALNAHLQRHDDIVKVERYEAPIILTREQTKLFLSEHIFCGSKIVDIDSIVSESRDTLLVARSDLFGQIDAPYNFQYLHPLYRQFLQELIIGSHWHSLILSKNNLAFSERYVILVKEVTSPSFTRLQSIFKEKSKQHPLNEDKIETVVHNIYEENCGKYYLSTIETVSPVKCEDEDTVE